MMKVPPRLVWGFFLGIALPAWFSVRLSMHLSGVLLHLFAIPIAFLAASFTLLKIAGGLTRWKNVRAAHRLGAVEVPKAQGKWIGNIDVLSEMLRRFPIEPLGEHFDRLHAAYDSDTLNLAVLGGDRIVTRDPAVVKHLLTGTGFTNSEKGALFHSIFDDFLGRGIFTSDREQWSTHRAMTRPYFVKERISDFGVFDRHTDHLISIIKKLTAESGRSLVHTDGAVDIQELLGRFTLDSGIEFLMGGDVDSLSEVEPGKDQTVKRATRFLKAFNAAQAICARRLQFADLWPVWEAFEKPNTGDVHPTTIAHALMDELISKALNKNRKVDEQGGDAGTLLDHLIKETRDPGVLRDETLNILLAARDTTMGALTASVYELARHPDIFSALRAEILAAFGKDSVPTSDEARKLKYLRAFIDEVLRLHPPVPFNSRTTIEEDVIVASDGRPLYFPPATRIGYSMVGIQRDPKHWGPSAAEFNPDRWIDEELLQYYKKNPFIFRPFSAGPRICVGQNFAYNEISFALIRLLQTFGKVEIAYDQHPASTRVGLQDGLDLLESAQITWLFRSGLWVRFHKDTVGA